MSTPTILTPEQAAALHANLSRMTTQEKLEALELLDKAAEHQRKNLARTDMIEFAKAVYPGFKVGPHHRKLAAIFKDVIEGRKKRVIINIAPRMGKSEFSSYLFPSYFLGNFPEKKIIMGTHTAGLSEDFGRRVRNLIETEEYRELFPATAVADDQKAAGKWSTSTGGQYYAAGVGGALAGRGADLFVIDDPHSEQDVKVNSRLAFDTAWSWFQTGPLQRLMPGGAIIIIMCMTGDTPVRMSTGEEKPLRDICVGDTVATFDNGRLSTSVVTNFRSNGLDAIYRIQTQSGRILRANERHPFLVMNNGVLEWTRLQHLKVGDLLVSLKGAHDPHGQRQSPDCATPAKQQPHTTASTPTPQDSPLGTTENGEAYCAHVGQQSKQKGCAPAATTNKQTPQEQSLRQKQTVRGGSSTATASLLSSMTVWLQSAATSAMSVASRLLTKTRERIGTLSSASTITMTPEQFEAFCATIAILRSDTVEQQAYLNALHDTSDFTADKITSITADGVEEVFDVQIDRTENFIANGFVSHNTRWSKLDLTGRLLDYQTKNPESEPWEVVELPAILNEGTDREKSLWPEQWPLDSLKQKKAAMDPQYWNAQYMQNPVSNNAAIVSRSAWRIWDAEDPPRVDVVLQSWDTAFEAKTSADYSACTTWGVWYNEEEGNEAQLILLDAFKDRMEFPELKEVALKHYKQWQPDMLIVEKKAAGAPLIQELRRTGLSVDEFSPSRGNDKIVRLNAIADIFASRKVWVPDTRWAREVVEEVASFPNGDHDDYVDCVSLALARFRQGGLIGTDKDENDEPYFHRRRAAYY